MTGARRVVWSAASALALGGGLTAVAAPAASARAKPAARVRSVANPPAQAPAKLTLRVRSTASRVSIYASPAAVRVGRKPVRPARGTVRLTRTARVRHGRVTVRVPRGLRPGAWYLLVCPAGSRRGCAASHRAMVKTPTRLAAPVNATPVPDAARGATATIGSAGGTLTATAANGTTFTLQIPARSVPDGTQISMTPLASVAGAGWAGRLVGAVQLAPEGLSLIHGGTLTITPKQRVPVSSQVAFGYTGAGSDVHLVPLAPTTKSIQIPLAHFSGAGLGSSPGGATPPSTGSTTLDFYGQLVAEALQQARDGEISDDQAFAEARGWLQDALADVMREEVPPGLNDDTAAMQAIHDLLTIARDMALIGDQTESTLNAVTPTIDKLLEGMYNRAQTRCAGQHDLTQISKVLNADRNEQLLGYQNHQISQDLQCARFKIDFDSLIQITPGGSSSGTWSLEYGAEPEVTPDAAGGYQYDSGDTTGAYKSVSGVVTTQSGGTSTATGGTGADFHVLKLVVPFDPASATPPQLVLSLGQSSEVYVEAGGGHSASVPGIFWWGNFTILHPPDANSGGQALTLQRVGGDGALVARGTYNGTVPAEGVTEATTVDVFHDPPAWTGH